MSLCLLLLFKTNVYGTFNSRHYWQKIFDFLKPCTRRSATSRATSVLSLKKRCSQPAAKRKMYLAKRCGTEWDRWWGHIDGHSDPVWRKQHQIISNIKKSLNRSHQVCWPVVLQKRITNINLRAPGVSTPSTLWKTRHRSGKPVAQVHTDLRTDVWPGRVSRAKQAVEGLRPRVPWYFLRRAPKPPQNNPFNPPQTNPGPANTFQNF